MRRYLKDAGVHAEITPDGFTEGGFVLSIGVAEHFPVSVQHSTIQLEPADHDEPEVCAPREP